MEFNWDDFKSQYQNEQEARQGFTQLCDILMTKNYPEFIIKNSDNIKEENNKVDNLLTKKCKVFLPKYFLDGVSNSRKGQIRKSLNDNLPYMKANKITEWYLMMPLEFSPEEQNWWENWSLRIKQENGVTPYAILSSKIVDLVSDLLDFDFKGTEKIPKKISQPIQADQTPESTDGDMLIFVEEEDDIAASQPVEIVAGEPESEPVSEPVSEPTPELEPAAVEAVVSEGDNKSIAVVMASAPAPSEPVQEEKVSANAREIQEPAPKGEDEAAASDGKTSHKKAAAMPEPALSQLKRTWDFKQKFEALEAEKLALPTDKSNNQRAVFDKRRENSRVKNYLNDFVFGDMSKFKGKELLKKGQIYVTNKQYSRGLYIYEYANAKQLLDTPELKNGYNKGADEANFKLTYKYFMILGDLQFAKRDYINASESYNKAINVVHEYEENLAETDSLDSSTYSSLIRDDEAETKHLEAKAESLLQVGEFAKAIDNFKAALALDPENEDLKKRLSLAMDLENSNYFKHPLLRWLNIFIAPFYYYRARKIDPNIRELQKADKLRNRAIWGIVVMLLIVLALIYLFVLGKRVVSSEPVFNDSAIPVQSAVSSKDQYMSRGDYYMANISDENPHYIDSAICAYDMARRHDNTDTIAQLGYTKAMLEKEMYIKKVQQNINSDSATYFLSLRRPTEGLRLFKYRYDPNDLEKGKFGYVDTLGNVKIAPIYDFNYKKMDGAGETFHNGKAKVCLHVGNADTVYFWIDQLGNKIEGLD